MEGTGCEWLERIERVIGNYDWIRRSCDDGHWHGVRGSHDRKAGSEQDNGECEELHFLRLENLNYNR